MKSFLKSALPLAQAETGTTSWYALKIGAAKFGIFDTFADANGRDAHLSGEIAKALFAKAEVTCGSELGEYAECRSAKG